MLSTIKRRFGMKLPLFEQEQARIRTEKNHEKQQDGATKKACPKFEWRVSVTGKISFSIADIEESGQGAV